MRNIEIELPPAANPAQAEQAVEAALAATGLEVALRGSLRKFPGCIHWHARQPGRSGTLEVTLWPEQHRAWLTIQSGRAAGWIAAKLPEIRAALGQGLAARPLAGLRS